MNRGAAKSAIYQDNRDRLVFLEILGKESIAAGIQIHGICLMDNHYHFLVHTPATGLGIAMKMIGSRYTQWYNARHNRDGALFRGRYRAIGIEVDSYLLHVSRYIHLNPVDAEIVARPEEYSWSSYRAYIGKSKKPEWLHTSVILEMLSADRSNQSYQEFVGMGNDQKTSEFFQRQRPGINLGDKAFYGALKERNRGLTPIGKRNS